MIKCGKKSLEKPRKTTEISAEKSSVIFRLRCECGHAVYNNGQLVQLNWSPCSKFVHLMRAHALSRAYM